MGSLGDQDSLVRRFRSELHESVQFIQDPKMLRESIAKLYRKQAQEQVRTGELDIDIQSEYHRQREYLERSVDSLKRKFARDVQLHKQDNMRIMQENMNLIKEINDLRQQQQALRLQQQEASVLGTGGGKSQGRPPLHGGGRQDGGNPQEIIATQQEQLQSLRMQIDKMQQSRSVMQQSGAGAGFDG